MKKYSKKVQAIFTALFFTFFILSLNNFTVFAASNTVINEFPSQKNISIYKSWTIIFTSPINLNTINDKNITVTDSNSNLQSVSIKPGNNNKSIVINCPIGGYSPGETYYINISTKVTSSSNTPLKKTIKMTFTTSSQKEISNINSAEISSDVIQIGKNDSKNIESHIIDKTENENNNEIITLDSSNTSLINSKSGDIFLMEPTDENPFGFAGKVISNNTTSSGKNILEIAQPRIDEVLSEANFNIEKSLNKQNLISSTFPEGTTISFVKSIDSSKSDAIASLHSNALADIFQGEDIHISLPNKKYSLGGIEINNEPSIVLKNPKIITALDLKKTAGVPTNVKKLEARLNTTIECDDNINVKGNGQIQGNNISTLLGCDNSNKMALGNMTLTGVDMNDKIILGSMTYQIGALPVETIEGIEKIPFGATIFLYLTFDGKIEAEVNVNMKASCYIDKGIDINGTTSNNEKSDNTKTNFTIDGTASGDLKFGVGVGMGIVALGIVPADITADVMGDITGTVSGKADILNQTYFGTIDCSASLKLLSEGNLKIAITDGNLSKEISKKISFLDKTLYDWEYKYPNAAVIQNNVTKLIDYLPAEVNGENGVTFETRDEYGNYKDMIKVDNYIDKESHVYWGTDNPYYYLPAILNIDKDNEQFLAHPSAVTNAGSNLDNITCVKLNGDYGKVNLSGTANLDGTNGSVRFYIYKGKDNYNNPLWQSTDGGDFNLDIPYSDGDELYFGVDANGDDLYDWAIWKNIRFQGETEDK